MGAGFEFFLGGYDLEMLTIRQLLRTVPGTRVHDHQLAWGAAASSYRNEIADCLAAGNKAVLIELKNDLGLSSEQQSVIIVDHHDDRAGRDVPTSLEQVFELLKLPKEQWTTDYRLVAANDRGGVPGLRDAGATAEEIRTIRQRDRDAQGITFEEESIGKQAALDARSLFGGRLKVAHIPHDRTATVTDALAPEMGGADYENLVIQSPCKTYFYGSGWCIHALKLRYPGGWSGGELPERGFWGIEQLLDEKQVIKTIEGAMSTKPPSEIPVRAFHHILFWPVIMRGPARSDAEDGEDSSIEPFIKAFEAAGWKEEAGQKNGVHEDYSYAEVVYFHPFVRDFLFGDGKTTNDKRTLRRFARDDLKSLRVKIEMGTDQNPDPLDVALRVERAELLLIRPRIALFLVEVSNRTLTAKTVEIAKDRTPLNLQQVMYLQSQLRHIYPPYFKPAGHGDCPTAVEWNLEAVSTFQTTLSPESQFREFTMTGAEPPVYAHWRKLFENDPANPQIAPLRSALGRNSGGLFLQQLLDDRMPAMSFISVDNPREIHQDDEDRLPAFDTPALDYESEFRDRIREGLRYTRFRHWGTTYYCNGTSFTEVCNSEWFSNILLGHFRAHYSHLAVISQYQHAALLYFADELADCAKEMADGSAEERTDEGWRERLRKLQHRFLKFRTRSYFTEVSNQIQAKDLFRLWQDQLGTAALFERVSDASADVYEAVENHEMKMLTVQQKKLADVATVGLKMSIVLTVVSLIVAWAGLYNEKIKANPFGGEAVVWGPWIWLLLSGGVSLIAFLLFLKLANLPLEPDSRRSKGLRS